MQLALFQMPEHARVVTSMNESPFHSYIVKPCILPSRVVLQSLTYPGYSQLGSQKSNGDVTVSSFFGIVLTNGGFD